MCLWPWLRSPQGAVCRAVMARPEFPQTVLEFQQRFSSEDACRQYLFQCRWPDGFICPRCSWREYFRHPHRHL